MIETEKEFEGFVLSDYIKYWRFSYDAFICRNRRTISHAGED